MISAGTGSATRSTCGTLTVFNIGGNKYRLIARIRYDYRLDNVRHVLTHSEYDEGAWKDIEAMPATKQDNPTLPGRFEDLVALMPPRAILDDIHLENSVEMIDALMAGGTLSKGQEIYMETLVQLVQVYEAANHALDTAGTSGLDSLRHLMGENEMNASDLARLLGVHVSMGSKILKGDRSLTVEHLKKLSSRFKVSPGLFID